MKITQTFARITVLLAAIVLLPSCGWDSGSKPSFVLVNVLDKEFYDDCHIKGSINVPFENLESYALAHFDKDNTEIVVHCTNYKCTASGASWQMLHNLGFKKVYAYEGGTAEAKQAGLPVAGPCKQAYLNDYAKPASMQEASGSNAVVTISAEALAKKL